MTREEAIEIIRKEYLCVDRECDIERSCGKCPYMMPTKEPILEAYKMAIQALSQEPCDDDYQTDMDEAWKQAKREPCDDVVSRQAVLDCATLITSIPTEDWDIGDWVCLFRDRVSQLPSVRPQEPCDDAISRKSLKNKLQEQHDFFVNAYGGFSNLPQSDKARVDEMTNCIAMVVNEPPITPQQKMSKNDGIPEQWQELKETITEMRDNDGTCTQQEICKFLANYMDVLEKQMQEPKTGHWIKGEEWCETVDGFERWGNDYTCSECGLSLGRYTLTDFCPNCGAKMVEPQERSDKE